MALIDNSPMLLIQRTFRFLLDHVCFESGLLIHLSARGAIDHRLKERLEQLPSMQAREQLLLFIARQSREVYDSYVQSLRDSNQAHIANKLVSTEERLADAQPLPVIASERDEMSVKSRIEEHREQIVSAVNTFNIRPYLFELGVISLSDYDEIVAEVGERAQCAKLLEMLHRVDAQSRPFSHLLHAMQKRYSELVDVVNGVDSC